MQKEKNLVKICVNLWSKNEQQRDRYGNALSEQSISV